MRLTHIGILQSRCLLLRGKILTPSKELQGKGDLIYRTELTSKLSQCLCRTDEAFVKCVGSTHGYPLVLEVLVHFFKVVGLMYSTREDEGRGSCRIWRRSSTGSLG
jgi:hypothetical protein